MAMLRVDLMTVQHGSANDDNNFLWAHHVDNKKLDPRLVRANFKDRFGAAVGYLTATPAAIKLD
jgi:hypothetical protein